MNVESHIYLDLLERSLNATYPCNADATVHVLTKGYNLPCQLSVKLTCLHFFIVCDVPGNISKDIIQSSPSSKLHDSRPHQLQKIEFYIHYILHERCLPRIDSKLDRDQA